LLPITSCGAVADSNPTNGSADSGAADSTGAIQNCVNQAQSQAKILWIRGRPGRFRARQVLSRFRARHIGGVRDTLAALSGGTFPPPGSSVLLSSYSAVPVAEFWNHSNVQPSGRAFVRNMPGTETAVPGPRSAGFATVSRRKSQQQAAEAEEVGWDGAG
jgi:hypothetical protein